MHELEKKVRATQPTLGDGYESPCLASWIETMCEYFNDHNGMAFSHNELSGLLHTLIAARARNEKMAAEIAALRADVEQLRAECAFWRDRLRVASPKMDGQHQWRLSIYAWPPLVGPDADAVVRNALEAIRSQPTAQPQGDA